MTVSKEHSAKISSCSQSGLLFLIYKHTKNAKKTTEISNKGLLVYTHNQISHRHVNLIKYENAENIYD